MSSGATERVISTILSLAAITLDSKAWPREALDQERVELFAELLRDARDAAASTRSGWADPLPPLAVVADGSGGYLLADGWHRYEARRRLGAGFDDVSAAIHSPNGRALGDYAYELADLALVDRQPQSGEHVSAPLARESHLAHKNAVSTQTLADLPRLEHVGRDPRAVVCLAHRRHALQQFILTHPRTLERALAATLPTMHLRDMHPARRAIAAKDHTPEHV